VSRREKTFRRGAEKSTRGACAPQKLVVPLTLNRAQDWSEEI
jgi:hypothetical protein